MSTLHGLAALKALIHGVLACAQGIRLELDRFTEHPKQVDRALLNVEDGIAGALIHLDLGAYDKSVRAMFETKDDIVRVHDLFHEEADNQDTPDTFRFQVEGLVLGFNAIMDAGKFLLMERMADATATQEERNEARALLHGHPNVQMMRMDPTQFFRMFQPPPKEDPDA